jgi:hypothetical protein
MYAGHPNLTVDASVNSATQYACRDRWRLPTGGSLLLSIPALKAFCHYVTFGAALVNDTLAYVQFAYTGSATSAVINLDSGIVNNQHLAMTDIAANEFIPTWSKGTITIGTPQPTIALNPTSMVFNGTIGTANPASQALAITNTGAGTLSWTAITNQPWLSVNPTSGSGNGNPNVSVNLTGLASGTHGVIVWIHASNTPNPYLCR